VKNGVAGGKEKRKLESGGHLNFHKGGKVENKREVLIEKSGQSGLRTMGLKGHKGDVGARKKKPSCDESPLGALNLQWAMQKGSRQSASEQGESGSTTK